MTLYFAYGSNMGRAPMEARCPGAGAVGHRPVLRGLSLHHHDATATRRLSRSSVQDVHGVVWRLTPRDLAALNAYESLQIRDSIGAPCCRC